MSTLLRLLVLWAVFAPSPVRAAEPATTSSRLPPFDTVVQAVEDYFHTKRDYQPGDLITQADWKTLEGDLARLGWVPRESARLRGLMLGEKSFLPKQLLNKTGRPFMRQIAAYPLAYDKLDRLSGMAQGPATVQALIRGPDGYKMIEYMSTSSGGAELGNMLAQGPGGKDFNKPTGRVYTANQLLDELARMHIAEEQARRGLPARKAR